jgi:hypothetical protein
MSSTGTSLDNLCPSSMLLKWVISVTCPDEGDLMGLQPLWAEDRHPMPAGLYKYWMSLRWCCPCSSALGKTVSFYPICGLRFPQWATPGCLKFQSCKICKLPSVGRAHHHWRGMAKAYFGGTSHAGSMPLVESVIQSYSLICLVACQALWMGWHTLAAIWMLILSVVTSRLWTHILGR